MLSVPAHTRQRIAAHQRSSVSLAAFTGTDPSGGPLSPLNGRWMVTPRSADADTVRSLPRQRAECRELRATNPIATGAIGTNVARVVGTGIQPVFAPDATVLGWSDEEAAEWAATTAREFSLWADCPACDWSASQTFYELQASVLESRLTSGDCFTLLPDAPQRDPLMPYRLRLQVLEADRCGSPMGEAEGANQSAGVRRLNGDGAPQAYFIYDAHPGSARPTKHLLKGTWVERIGKSGRRRILHHYRPTRPEQTRGVPYLAPVIQTIRDLGRFSEAEITAAVINAFFTVFVQSGGSTPAAPVFGTEAAGPVAGEIALAPGAVVGLAAGETIAAADPKRPNPNAEGFIMGMLKLIGMGLGLPFEVLVKQYQSSFSASKAALLDAWMHFRTERAWLVNSFCQPVLETWLAEAVAIGRVSAPGFFTDPLMRWAYTRAAWHGDSQGSINPKDEVEAYRSAVDGRLMTHERAEWELFGSDWHATYPIKLRELKAMEKDGISPAPKAGAAAAAKPAVEKEPPDDPAKPEPEDDPANALRQQQQAHERELHARERQHAQSTIADLRQRLAAVEQRPEPAPPVINVTTPPVTVQTGDAHIHMPDGLVQLEAAINLPEHLVQLDAVIEPAAVHVAAPSVTVQATPAATPQATRQVITRDAAGEIASIVTVPIALDSDAINPPKGFPHHE